MFKIMIFQLFKKILENRFTVILKFYHLQFGRRTETANESIWYDIYLTAIGLTPGGSITRHIYNKQYTKYIESTILEVRTVLKISVTLTNNN